MDKDSFGFIIPIQNGPYLVYNVSNLENSRGPSKKNLPENKPLWVVNRNNPCTKFPVKIPIDNISTKE